MSGPDPAAILVKDLTVKRGGKVVLDGLSLSIERGTLAGLLGPSGSGKTTLMRAIVGVQRVESGTVHVLGTRAGTRELRERVGYVTQAPAVYPDLSVEENLRYFARILDAPANAVKAMIDTVGLGDATGRAVSTLSGGQLARVSLATAMLNAPDVLIMDEPTVGLDPVLREELWLTFRRLASDGATLLVSSHVMDEAERCEHLVLLRDGRLLAEDTLDGLLRRTGAEDAEGAFLSLVRSGEGT